MAGQIPQRFIDDLLARVDVVEVVGERVKLKKAGRNHSGLCPFHQEKSPSFTVSADKQFYHCFGCGAHGNALRFLMEYDKLRFPEAVEQLASRLGMEVPREGADDPRAQAREKKRKEGVNLLEMSASYFRERLKMPEGQVAREYLEQRGVSDEIRELFGIGYAPAQWEALKRHLGGQGVDESVQIEYGLLVHHEDSGRSYDRFRDRVVFPIRDIRGRTLGFGGRVMGDAKPKYLNSPETPVFHKGRELYGLYEARQASPKLERLLIVEGYMDVVALAQYGIHNAVATLGTATTADHLRRLFRLVSEVVFCFDGDKAGRQAAARALETVLPEMIDGRQARFLFLPEGEDPDSLVRREGASAFEDRVVCASPLSEFLFEHAAQGRDLAQLESRERYASQVLSAIEKMPQGVLKSLMLTELSRRTGVEQSRFEALLAPVVAEEPELMPFDDAMEPAVEEGQLPQRRRKSSAALGLMGRTLQLLVHEPRLVERLPESLEWCDGQGDDARLCRDVIELLRAGGYSSAQVLLMHFHGSEDGERLAALARKELLIPGPARAAELDGLVSYFQRACKTPSRQQEIDTLLAKQQSGERLSSEERSRLMSLLAARD
ncbi:MULTISPECIES: DNA primase [Halomonas]|uniref:DNA primase n=1 Tax=Halomonas TaxID=2745 RepID=UPI001A907F71|nr:MULTISPECIES: DNA primase [Halomonas]MBN8412303.1 DNA primase [Halomonas litopenaei]MBY5924579.1 DNA primase [Halomonas sp. DP4Y7-2]MBY5984083.1 DNA primase [Halomonas sp. DP5Y7-2]MBY6231621.1 DNA primase [Halomonas sp. DP4Y7-1]